MRPEFVCLFVCHREISQCSPMISGSSNPPLSAIFYKGILTVTHKDSQISVPLSPDLSQVVTTWAKLPAPLKAAILAIVNSAEGQP